MAGKLLVTGAGGQLGRELAKYFSQSWAVIALTHADLDILNRAAVTQCLTDTKADWVLHAAALTDVDSCEKDPELAMAVNADGAGVVARACAATGARLLYYSTDYVFDGGKSSAYTEDDLPNPQSVYGRSKLAGEEQVQRVVDDHVIMRIAWLYGGESRNFVSTMITAGRKQVSARAAGQPAPPLTVVADQCGCPTWTYDVARQTEAVINSGLEGLFHAASKGVTSRFEFAREIFAAAGMTIDVVPCRTDEFPRPAPRPANSALANRRLAQAGINVMRPWKSALAEFLHQHYPVGSHE